MLLEREPQMAALRGVVFGSEGRLVLVGAEAGAGKTSLVRALVSDTAAAGVRGCVAGGCDSMRTARPFGPILEWGFSADPPLADLVRAGAAPASVVDRVFAMLAREKPVAIIEDAHWADDATVDLLLYIGRRVAQIGAVLVVTYRPEEVVPGSPLAFALGDLATSHPVKLNVPPLSRDAVAALARGRDVDIEDLVRRTKGNAFFVTECLVSDDSVPGSVRDAVLARTHRLSPAAVGAAEVVSIFPGQVGLSAVASLGGSAAGLDECLDDGLVLLEFGSLRFRHELARVAVTDAIPAARRRNLHRQALSLVERESPVDEARAVHHALEAGDTVAVVRHAIPAAEHAQAAGARREAIAHLELGLRVGGDLPAGTRRTLLTGMAALFDETGDYERAIEAYSKARSLTPDPTAAAMLLLKTFNPLTMAGQLANAATCLDEALAVLNSVEAGPELALAYAQRCALLMLTRRLREAGSWGARAMELAKNCDDRDTLSYTQIQSGTALFMSGNRSGYARVRAGIATALREGSPRLVVHGLSQIGSGGGEIRDYSIAVPALREAIAFAKDNELQSRGLYSQAWLGRCLVELCMWDEATGVLTANLASARVSGVTRMTALTALGRLRGRRGDPDPAALLDEALMLARETRQLQRLWPVAAARAEVAWLSGRLASEAELVLEVLHLARGLDQPWATGELAFWTRRAGQALKAADAKNSAAPFALALTGRARDAATAWRRLGCFYDAADALADSQEDADQIEALAIWKGLGAGPAQRLLVEQRRAAGRAVPRGPNSATLGNAAGLTSREMEVLSLLVEGLNNPAIAARAHLSVKTVGHHVSNILAKLNVANRTEAVSAALNLGIRLPKR